MTYKQMIDLGFQRIHDSDPVWFNQYGYDYFRVEYQLDDTHYIDWDVQKQTCDVVTINSEHDVLNRWKVDNIEIVRNVIQMFTKKKKEAFTFATAC